MANPNRPSSAGGTNKSKGAAPTAKSGTPRRDPPKPEPRSVAGDFLVPGAIAILLVGALAFYFRGRNAVPPEPISSTDQEAHPSSGPSGAGNSNGGSNAPTPAPPTPSAARVPETAAQDVTLTPTHPDPTRPDPLHGEFTLTQATAGLPAGAQLVADIETSMGTFNCTLLPQQAPVTVANFVGLARGLRDFWDPVAGSWTRRPYFDGSVFHRVIPDFMIQGGDILRSGRGGPGYTIPDENAAHHNEPGMLCMANRGPNTGGSQFFILETARPNLDGSYSVFGRCTPTNLVGRIARTPRNPRDTPLSPVFIQHVRIHR